jgi:hypothetical protein
MKKFSVAVIASSGGGAATLGHTNAVVLLQTVNDQLSLINARVVAALYVSLDGGKGMDSANEQTDHATLYQVDEIGGGTDGDLDSPFLAVHLIKRGTLSQVNEYCLEQENKIAQSIEGDQIHGLICISCHVGIFERTLRAAAKKKIPVTGSGGSSLSSAASLHEIVLVGNAGGSVATTSYTRAVSFTHSLSVIWNIPYEPWKKPKGSDSQGASLTSILNACLPSFWGVCIAKCILGRASCLPGLVGLIMPVFENHTLPTICAVVAATSCCTKTTSQQAIPTSSLIMATVIASAACSQSVVSGLLAGWLVSQITDRMMFMCIFRGVPATMTNMISAGGVGVIVLMILSPVAPVFRLLTRFIRYGILCSVTWSSMYLRGFAGFAWGCLSCYGSKVGWYHSFFLPGILIEMELGEPSFLGAIDVLTLVLVCAGICFGNLASRRLLPLPLEISDSDAALCKRGLYINLLCGDFVEVCYPFMERHVALNAGGYLASGLSTAWLVLEAQEGKDVPKSMAYLPVVVSLALSGAQSYRMMVASAVAFGFSFLTAFIHHTASSMKKKYQ